MLTPKKRCRFCRAIFHPDPRTATRQFACSNPTCRHARKRASQQAWLDAHPGYFTGQYRKKEAWRAAHPAYSTTYRQAHPEAAARHRTQEKTRRKWLRDHRVDIQDEMSRQVLAEKGLHPEGAAVDMQDEIRTQTLILIGLVAQLRRVDQQDEIDFALCTCYMFGRLLHRAATAARRKKTG